MWTCPKVLLATDDEMQFLALQKLLLEYATMDCAASLIELRYCLESDTYDVVLCAWSFHAGWNKVVHSVHQQVPELPVIVLSRTGGEAEWSEVLRAGAFDLVAGPFRERSMLAAVEQAAASYRARSLRDLTPEKVS